MLLQIIVKPNSKKSELIELKNSQLSMNIIGSNIRPDKYFIAYLKNKPKNGKANNELINLLQNMFPNANTIKIIKGTKNTKKLIKIQ